MGVGTAGCCIGNHPCTRKPPVHAAPSSVPDQEHIPHQSRTGPAPPSHTTKPSDPQTPRRCPRLLILKPRSDAKHLARGMLITFRRARATPTGQKPSGSPAEIYHKPEAAFRITKTVAFPSAPSRRATICINEIFQTFYKIEQVFSESPPIILFTNSPEGTKRSSRQGMTQLSHFIRKMRIS